MRSRLFCPSLRASVAVLGIATAVTAVAPARAQDAQTQAMGRALFNEGVALFNKGDYEAACPKLEASLKSYPGLGTRGKLAECYEKLGHYASAYAAYREVAQLAMRSGDLTREQVASERAKSLEPKLSYLTLVVAPGTDVYGMVIKRNGREVDRAKIGGAEPVDAGTVVIEVTAPGRKTFTTQVSVQPAQSQRLEIPALESSSILTGGGTTPPPGHDEPTTVRGDPPAWQKPLGLVFVGGGAVAMGVGGVLGLAAKSKYDGAFDKGGGCDGATKECDTSGQAAVDDARSKATISTILFAAGGGLVVIGAVIFLTAPSSSKPRAVTVAPTTYAGGAGISLGGTL